MAAPSLYTFKTHGGTRGGLWWASIHHLGRFVSSTPRQLSRVEAQGAAREAIRQLRAAMNARAADMHALEEKTRRTIEANHKGGQ
jgi:hypothetical protein